MESRTPIITEVFGNPETWADPYPAYREYREQSPLIAQWPIVLMDGTRIQAQTWSFLKFADVFAALRDHTTFSSQNPMPGTFAPKLVMIQDDPPRHTRFRRIVSKVFTPKRIAELEPWISTVANELLDQISSDSVDVVNAFTFPLPVLVIAQMLGIPGEDYLKFKQWSDALVAVASFGNKMQDRSKSIDEMMAYFGKMAAMRRTKRAEDLVTALVEADIEGEKLEEWEVLGFCMLLLVAGNETTTNLLSNLLSLLAGRDDLWQRLREDRTLVDAAIDESLRHESPVQFLVRFTTRDVEVSGITIGQGMPVSVSFGAANRDPAAFERPDEFLLDRNLSNHVAFGAGIHFCLGAPLAKVEARVSLNALLGRFERIEKGAGPGVRQRESNLLLGFSKLPLRLVA